MKRLLMLFYTIISILPAFAQNAVSDNNSNIDSKLINIQSVLEDIDFRIRGLDRYKLYTTENTYIMLKLDTMTGKIDLVQWSLESEKEFTVSLNSVDLSRNTGCGTFELYPTKNMFQFILLNKVDGRLWHVQWGFEKGNQWIKQIY